MDILKRKIILASKSPRRSFLLKEAGFNIEIRTNEVEEDYPETIPTKEVAEYLAIKKAKGSRDLIQSKEEVLLAADSVVILDDVIYGKPKDKEDAKRILRLLSGNIHQVITGVCLLSEEKMDSFSGISNVHFEPLTEEEIEYYVENFKPYDKAGAYAIQEWIGLCKISKIEGLYSNIMGLPVEMVYQRLKHF